VKMLRLPGKGEEVIEVVMLESRKVVVVVGAKLE